MLYRDIDSTPSIVNNLYAFVGVSFFKKYWGNAVMAIHVIQSQRIDVLVQGLLQNTIRSSKNPFAVLQTQHFIVPSPAVQEWLSQRIAEQPNNQ